MHVYRRRWDYHTRRQPTPYPSGAAPVIGTDVRINRVVIQSLKTGTSFRRRWDYYVKRQPTPYLGVYAPVSGTDVRINRVVTQSLIAGTSFRRRWNYYIKKQPTPYLGVYAPVGGGCEADVKVSRIVTQGLRTGACFGGVKYILRRGLVSDVFVPILRRDLMAIEREGKGAAVAPSDTVDLPNSGILYIGGAGSGNLKVDLISGGTVTFVGIPANTWIDRVRVKRVWATGTDVTSILAFY